VAAAADALRQRGIQPQILRTEQPGHAVELASAAARSGMDLLLVSGGDGTVRDAVQGLVEAEDGSDVPVGILPGGTGNDLIRTLGVPAVLAAALDVALAGEERALDVWRWNEAAFVNVAGVGLDAAVAGTANRKLGRMRGTPAYLAAFFLTLPGARPTEIRLEWPGGAWSGRAWLTAFGNGRCYGGGMQIAPEAVPDDGLLDLVVVEDLSKLELLRQFPRIFAGTHIRHPRVKSFRVESVRVEAPPQEATIDGELIGSTPASVTRAARRLRVRVPRR
jgi:diacylglycerol kinase (ATP)